MGVTFVFMFAVSLMCAFGIEWAPLLWLPACGLFFPMWLMLQIVSGRQGDAPDAALDEYELAQRNNARSIGLTITQNLMLVPIFYLIFGSVITGGTDTDMAYAGGLMALTVLLNCVQKTQKMKTPTTTNVPMLAIAETRAHMNGSARSGPRSAATKTKYKFVIRWGRSNRKSYLEQRPGRAPPNATQRLKDSKRPSVWTIAATQRRLISAA